jgi:hypothetical protein
LHHGMFNAILNHFHEMPKKLGVGHVYRETAPHKAKASNANFIVLLCLLLFHQFVLYFDAGVDTYSTTFPTMRLMCWSACSCALVST